MYGLDPVIKLNQNRGKDPQTRKETMNAYQISSIEMEPLADALLVARANNWDEESMAAVENLADESGIPADLLQQMVEASDFARNLEALAEDLAALMN